MRRLLLLALALGLFSPALAQVKSVPTQAAGLSSLARLGSVLGTLPGLPALTPGAGTAPSPIALPSPLIPSLTPHALHDLSKAAVLLERAQPLLARQAERTEAPAAPESAVKTLEAVNAALKDFSADELRSMPEEQLSRLAGLVLDRAAARPQADDLEAVAVLAQANLAKVEGLRGRPLSEKLLNPGHPESHADMVDVDGVPERVKAVEHDAMVFRHYTTAEGLQGILRTGGLWNGFLSYVELASGVYKKTFKDLTGLFLTKPEVDGGRVGVPAKEFDHYVDVKVSPKLPVLEVEKGQIFLVPLPARTRGWVADLYRKWVGGGDPGYYRQSVEELDSRGGPGPELSVPVEVVDYGKVGEKGRLARLLESARGSTKKAVAKALKRKADGVSVTKILADTDTKTITEYAGVPGRVERLDTQGRVYRHWIRDEETFRAILGTRILKAGPTSYVDFTGSRHAFIKDIYPELRGIFFTLPSRSSAEPRVMNEAVPYYIDFEVPEGVEALRLDGDDVLMIPAEPGTEVPVRIVGSSAES